MEYRDNTKDSLVRSAGRGAAWQVAGGGWHAFFRLAASTVLCRFLTPVDFGIVSMAIIAREFIRHIGNLGMGAGIIAKKNLTKEDLNVCFWCLTCAALLLLGIAYMLAPLVSVFFQTPEVSAVVKMLSLTFVFDFLRIIPVIRLQKDLRFRPIILIRSVGLILELAIVIVLVVVYNYNYWALVYGMLFNSIFNTVIIFIHSGWMPGISMNMPSFKYFMRFGLYLQGSSIVNFLHHHLDYIIIGYILGTAQLGYYQFATKIPDLFKQRIAMPLAAVIYPAISRFQDHNDQLLKGYCKAIQYVSLGIFPALGGIAVMAHELVLVLWGANWLPVVFPLQIFCLCGAIRCIMTPIGSVFNSKQRPDLPFKINIMQLGVTFVSTASLGYLYGLNGVAFGMMLAQFFSLVALKIMSNLVGTTLKSFLLSLKEATVATAVMMLAVYGGKKLLLSIEVSAPYVMLVCIILGMSAYIITLRSLYQNVYRDVIQTFSHIVGEKSMRRLKQLGRTYI